MVRVGGLQLLQQQGSTKRDPAGLTPLQQLEAVSERTHQMMRDQYACFLDELEPRLGQGRHQADHAERPVRAAEESRPAGLREEIFAVYTPMAVHAPDEFPLVGNKTLNVCVRLAPRPRKDSRRGSR